MGKFFRQVGHYLPRLLGHRNKNYASHPAQGANANTSTVFTTGIVIIQIKFNPPFILSLKLESLARTSFWKPETWCIYLVAPSTRFNIYIILLCSKIRQINSIQGILLQI